MIPPGGSWTGDFPASPSFEIQGVRLDSSVIPLAWPYALAVAVDGRPVVSGLSNKGARFAFISKVGCASIEQPYFLPSAQAWVVFPSPDFYFFDSGRSLSVAGGKAYRYVWDVSSLISGAPTMSVMIRNTGLGSPNNGSAGNLPLIVRVPRPLFLEAETDLFSPNGDGVMDTATFSIRASVPWRLKVDGDNVVAKGSPAAGQTESDWTIAWDGKIDGETVLDGVHYVRVEHDAPTPLYGAVEVSVSSDTTPPKVDFAVVAGVSVKEDRSVVYDLAVSAKDPVVGEVSSGLATESAAVRFRNATLTGPTKRSVAPDGSVRLEYRFSEAGDRDIPMLYYSAGIADRAGNRSPLFNGHLEGRVEGTVKLDLAPPDSDALAGLAAPLPLTTNSVFYVKSDTGLRIEVESRVVFLDHRDIPVPRDYSTVLFVERATGRLKNTWIAWTEVELNSGRNPSYPVFTWNGKARLATGWGDYAPEGRYRSGTLNRPVPGFVNIWHFEDGIEFLVSDHEVLRLNEWKGAAMGAQSIGQAYHVLAAHLLPANAFWLANRPLVLSAVLRRAQALYAPRRPGWKSNIRAQSDFFRFHDSAFAMGFASGAALGLSAKAQDLFGPYEKDALDSDDESVIRSLMAQPEYALVMQIASGLWAADDSGREVWELVDNEKARALARKRRGPAVLPSGAVRWIQAVSKDMKSFVTVFPDVNFQKDFEDELQEKHP